MFNIGGGEILVIALVALIAVGPEQLPGVMRKIGAFANQVRTMTVGIRDEFMSTVDEANPNNWTGDGSEDKPIVPRGYAENTIKNPATPSASFSNATEDAPNPKGQTEPTEGQTESEGQSEPEPHEENAAEDQA